MKWSLLNDGHGQTAKIEDEEIIKILLENRGLKTAKQKEEFLNPVSPAEFTAKDLGIAPKELQKAIKRIKTAVKKGESIIVYGDYDADGICATAILWETLYQLTKNVLPYIPERVSEGYGLNKESILQLKTRNPQLSLIITVDHGITAGEKIQDAQKLGIDVIVCDHHQPSKNKPKCTALVYTEQICAAAIAWFLSQEILKKIADRKLPIANHLDLVAIASIGDLEPLIGANRSFVKHGLEVLNKTQRCGLLAIMEEAGIEKGEIGTYEIGYIIAPRLNAMGRMEHALESLRLLCTSQDGKARDLASKLGLTNRERQLLTQKTARQAIDSLKLEGQSSKLIFVAHESYNQGIIGLVAGKLVEEFYRPAIVISLGEIYSKASARSISGFNIIEAIRAQADLLVDAGGHPMAAGFTVETVKIEELKKRLSEAAEKEINEEILAKILKIDLEIPIEAISLSLWEKVQMLAPFGLGNPEPVLATEAVVEDFRLVGMGGKHLKLTLSGTLEAEKKKTFFGAIAFGQGFLAEKLVFGEKVKVAFTLSLNEWNGEKKLELKIKDTA